MSCIWILECNNDRIIYGIIMKPADAVKHRRVSFRADIFIYSITELTGESVQLLFSIFIRLPLIATIHSNHHPFGLSVLFDLIFPLILESSNTGICLLNIDFPRGTPIILYFS